MATAARSSSILRRSLLYVPASSQNMLSKSLGLASDNITYDLEDSVTPALKPTARDSLRAHFTNLKTRPSSVSELAVRINAVPTPFALQDLTALASAPLVDAVVVPKVECAADLTFVSDVLRHVAPERHASGSGNPIKIIALIESARAVMDLGGICKATPYLSGLIFAAEDFALDLSITRTPSLTEFLFARSAIVTAARAAGLPSAIDLVCTSYKGDEGLQTLRDESAQGKSMGFNGKQCIHPSQVEVVQAIFAPAPDEVEWAVRITTADEKAAASGRGAWTLDGKMIDAPVVGKAHAITAKAEQCGFDVHDLRNKWKDQEPE
ncbi:hpcH/HpaI aldolase/citrate lyase family protein [Hirsutella rhossiliensis]|uniref:HpcH/HpaI aldolase/citrate lyase family domain-containing protein n=1 Tax=Hirsutella rhossiliensis TaxID=111463 RepID=A0A9P8SIN7_9HYPO|nr:hpcH/HpaI aldolase/citrate lyase family domain-containing protein [Hirsutella rhossiliensis]KAH0963379.1 hpcH/HpaI aldolase/citrate lyase family domain-containing protein [Hirsutella rhossiliensis]